jgi:hypothetical protein
MEQFLMVTIASIFFAREGQMSMLSLARLMSKKAYGYVGTALLVARGLAGQTSLGGTPKGRGVARR